MGERGEDGGEGKGSCKLALLFFPLVWPYPRTYDEEVLCTNVYGAVQSWAPAMYDLPSSDLNKMAGCIVFVFANICGSGGSGWVCLYMCLAAERSLLFQ